MTTRLKTVKKEHIELVKRRFGIVGNASSLNRAIDMALRVAPTTMNVLITGENGSGKESFSKIIHHFSGQKHGKLVAVNCGALPEGTIDSALFGHEKGAFTGAFEARKGYFAEANGGTIFLDEIGEMPLATQSRLLRVLEYGEFMKVGSAVVEKTSVRVVGATHVDLLSAVRKGSFREDLYYRLNTVSLRIPPLRERGSDIELLTQKFSVDFAEEYGTSPLTLTREAKKRLLTYPFPGNIRELKNLVARIAVFEEGRKEIAPEVLERYLPSHREGLPVLMGQKEDEKALFSEREILYKVLFDMQQELMELKRIVYQNLKEKGTSLRVAKQPTDVPPEQLHSLDITEAEEARSSSLEKKDFEVAEPLLSLEEVEKNAIQAALKYFDHNRKQVAKALIIPERTLYRKIKKYNL